MTEPFLPPHILLNLKDDGNSIYVLEGESKGWHDFRTKDGTINYMKKLSIKNIDFVLNPNW
jgi:hypothetical protein